MNRSGPRVFEQCAVLMTVPAARHERAHGAALDTFNGPAKADRC